MDKKENNKINSAMVWGALSLAIGCMGYVISGKLWFLIGGIVAVTIGMIFKG